MNSTCKKENNILEAIFTKTIIVEPSWIISAWLLWNIVLFTANLVDMCQCLTPKTSMCSAYLNPKSTARVVNYSKDFNFTFCNSYTYFFHWSVATRNFFFIYDCETCRKKFLEFVKLFKRFFQIFIHFFLLYFSVATRKTVFISILYRTTANLQNHYNHNSLLCDDSVE